MTLDELNGKLTLMMKQFIHYRNHIDTGRMYKTTRFTSSMVNGDLKIKFTAPYYIQYLDDGEFVRDFLNLPAVTDVIATFVAEDLEESL